MFQRQRLLCTVVFFFCLSIGVLSGGAQYKKTCRVGGADDKCAFRKNIIFLFCVQHRMHADQSASGMKKSHTMGPFRVR